jgi:2-polyprenyl-3-methyl-5-hydroxy-6-metoxy-1,4-benzoquinol methylase
VDHDLESEAKAFGERARERVRNGHIPDLRRVTPCDAFYNNPWRRPYLANMVFGASLDFLLAHLHGETVLEVGSGVGYMTLELARQGYHVTGLELSEEAVEIAKEFASANPWRDGFGSLQYLAADFLSWRPDTKYDNVVFHGTLHHFTDCGTVLRRTRDILAEGGHVLIVEPARDYHTENDAAVIAMIRTLLAAFGGWYEDLVLPTTMEALEFRVRQCLDEYREAHETTEAPQSPHDNASFADHMLAELRSQFHEIAMERGCAFFPRIGGGVRAGSEAQAEAVARFLFLFDQYAVQHGLMNPGVYRWAGTK